LEQQAAQVQQGQIMGTDHTYVIPATGDRRAANVKKCAFSPHSPLHSPLPFLVVFPTILAKSGDFDGTANHCGVTWEGCIKRRQLSDRTLCKRNGFGTFRLIHIWHWIGTLTPRLFGPCTQCTAMPHRG